MKRFSDDYTAFFRAEYERVVRTVELILGDHEAALDITQEAFARLYRNWRKVSRYEQPHSWVRRIAINLSISHLRRRRVQEKALGLFLPAPHEATFPDDRILTAVRQLPPAQRAATVLFYFEDMPTSDIARLLECSESTARVHLHKARARLAKLLGGRERDERSVDVAR